MALDGRSMQRLGLQKRWRVLVILLLVLGGPGCSAVVKNAEHQVYSKPKYGSDRFIRARHYNVHYVELGEGRPLLLIPGAFTTYRAWDRMLPELALHNRVLAVDYLGVGDSDKPERGFRYTVEEQADVMAEMIVALRLSQVSVVGASYGGAVALNLAARYPDLVDKVVCIEGGALITPEALNYSKLASLVAWPVLGDITWVFMRSGLFDAMAARSVMGKAWEELTSEEQNEITGIVSTNIMTVSRSSWTNIYRAITTRIDFTEAMEHMRAPVLYLYGENSKYRAVAEMNVRRFEQHNPNVETISFPGGIHDLHLQYPHEVTGAVLRFLGPHSDTDLVAGVATLPRIGEVSDPDGRMY